MYQLSLGHCEFSVTFPVHQERGRPSAVMGFVLPNIMSLERYVAVNQHDLTWQIKYYSSNHRYAKHNSTSYDI
jgi:hypothetical protein